MLRAAQMHVTALLVAAVLALPRAAGAEEIILAPDQFVVGPVISATPPSPVPEGMVWISGGTFLAGAGHEAADEGPTRTLTIGGFFLDRTEVTVAEFGAFVCATGHRTLAERTGRSRVFDLESGAWQQTTGATYLRPYGPEAPEAAAGDPVRHVSHGDALAYAAWAGKRLPTDTEWEFAARGGLDGAAYPWGDERRPEGRILGNFYQGPFPDGDEGLDGFRGIAPVAQFPANPYGLHDMAGNVWEWCTPAAVQEDEATLLPTADGGPVEHHGPLACGGSFLCAEYRCEGFRPAARRRLGRDESYSHVGFRCAMDPPPHAAAD